MGWRRILTVLLLAGSLSAQTQYLNWQSHTAVSDVRDLCVSGPVLWAATTGGLRAYKETDGLQQIWTNTEGLVTNQLLSIATDGDGGVWLGHASGHIQHYSPQLDRWKTIGDYEDHPVTCLVKTGDTLWVGLDIGVSLYRLDRDEVKETYRRFGRFSADLTVNSLAVDKQKLWVATDEGVAAASLAQVNLLDPAAWQIYDESDGLPDQQVRRIQANAGEVVVASNSGAARYSNGRWTTIYEGPVEDLLFFESDLYVATSSGVFMQSGETWLKVGQNSGHFNRLIASNQALYGSGATAIRAYGWNASTTEWSRLSTPSLAGNWVSSMLIDPGDRVWTTQRDGGISVYHNGDWTSFTPENLPEMKVRDWTSLGMDAQGNVWAGSWGHGLLRFAADGSTVTGYSTENSVLSGISEDRNYEVITGLFQDSYGTLWIMNYRAEDGNPLIAVDGDGHWTEYGQNDNLNSAFVRDMAEDPFGRKWVATEYGLYLLDDRGTPADKNDDPSIRLFTMANGLLSNDIRALATSSDGTVYIGSGAGVNTVFDVQFSTLFNIPVASVSALETDGAGNLWAGTGEGLAFFSPRNYQWTLYQTDDGLAHDDVKALTMDYDRGILYIGTNGGLSVVDTPFSSPSETLDKLTAYPNPYKPVEDVTVAIDGLGEDVEVAFFNSAGFKVRQFAAQDVMGRRLIWDGRDSGGHPVPSGIYIVVGVNEEGKTQKGKLTLIR